MMTAKPVDLSAPVSPGATIGIVGSGQLARMLALAAARLGLKCHIYADTAGPAFDVAAALTIAPYDDRDALAAFAADIAVATYEFENIPAATVETLAARVPVRPGARALGITQDRVAEKELARKLGAQTADFARIDTLADLERCLGARTLALPAILKTRRFGYDGKGQARIVASDGAGDAWRGIGAQPAILERVVGFEREVSIVAVRTAEGDFRAYDAIENVHRDHILHTSTVPAALRPATAREGAAIARKIADALDYVGTFAVEFFALDMGGREHLLVNEIAPRVHNSGHWTIDACAVSQFENHVRAVAGWPLGSTARHSNAVMTNLIGHEIDDWEKIAAEAGQSAEDACLHIYGKREARAARKMGHVTRLSPRI